MPELIAPTELFTYPGRGGALVFELDDDGSSGSPTTTAKTETADAGAPTALPSRRRRRWSDRLAESEGRGGSEEGARARGGQEEVPVVAGKESPEEEEARRPRPRGRSRRSTKGLRWVAITGVLDYKKLRDNYLTALKKPEVAYPHFKQLDVERQIAPARRLLVRLGADRRASGTTRSSTTSPRTRRKLTPDAVRIDALVDPLPFLKAGYWERVHVASLVPTEKIEVAEARRAGAGPAHASRNVQRWVGHHLAEALCPSRGAPMGMGGGMEMMGRRRARTTNFPKTDADTVMIRSLDFTVEPDKTYRFRVRIVVYNPNHNREDVTPGVDTKSVELFGPWSEPTDEVTMPADVTAYAMRKSLTSDRGGTTRSTST